MNLWCRLRAFLPRYRAAQERDMQEELESLKAMAGKNELGNLTLAAENARESWRWSWLETVWQDVRYSLRTLRKSPGFTITAVAILSIGIGLNLTFFQLVNGVFLKPLPVRDAGSLVHVTVPAEVDSLNYAAMELIRSGNNVFSAVLMDMRTNAREHQLEWGDNPTPLKTYFVSPNWFDELGVKALRGRLFSESVDGGSGARPVAVISQRYWETQLQSNPDVIGTTVRLSKTGGPLTIIGVVPRTLGSFQFNGPQVWVPVEQFPYLFPQANLRTREAVWGRLYGRLLPGVSLAAASEGLQPILEELARQQPIYLRQNTVALFGGSSNFRQPFTTARIWRALAVGGSFTMLILLITCANLANLVLSRTVSRVQELSVRVSLGASRARIARHLLTETTLLSIVAAGGGLLVAYWGTRLAATFNGDLLYGDLSIDWHVLAIASSGAIVMAALVGALPAWTIGKRDLAIAMKDGGEQTSYSLSRVRHRQYLLAAQVAGSCLLLVVAGLVLRTFQQVMVPPGFDYENVLVAERLMREKDAAPKAYWTSLRHNIAQQPEIESVALAREKPFGNFSVGSVPALPNVRFNLARVEPDFFRVLRIPFLAGKPFTSSDVEGQAIVLSKSLALQVFGTVDVVGKLFPGSGRVAGVVDDVRLTRPEDPDRLEAYAPLDRFDRVVLLARSRTVADVARLIQALPQSLRPLDSRIPTLYPLKREVNFVLEEKQRMSTLLSSLAAIALAVSCMGVFGVVSYTVALRRKEIGIRLALGAPRPSIVRLMARQLIWPVSLASFAGAIGGVAVGKVFADEGHFSAPNAPVAAAAILVLLAAVGLACIVPTLRALRSSDIRVLS